MLCSTGPLELYLKMLKICHLFSQMFIFQREMSDMRWMMRSIYTHTHAHTSYSMSRSGMWLMSVTWQRFHTRDSSQDVLFRGAINVIEMMLFWRVGSWHVSEPCWCVDLLRHKLQLSSCDAKKVNKSSNLNTTSRPGVNRFSSSLITGGCHKYI